MAKHAAPRRRQSLSGRGRVAAGLVALCVAGVLLMGGQGTFAFWTDSATVTTGSISSGKLDLQVDGSQGNPTAYAKTSLAMSSMVPGESVAANIAVSNAGDASFVWVPTASTGGGLGPALQVELFRGATVSGQTTTYPRTQTCSGGTKLTSGSTGSTLAKGAAAQNLCVQVTLPTTTGDAFQNVSTGSVTITLTATQVLP